MEVEKQDIVKEDIDMIVNDDARMEQIVKGDD